MKNNGRKEIIKNLQEFQDGPIKNILAIASPLFNRLTEMRGKIESGEKRLTDKDIAGLMEKLERISKIVSEGKEYLKRKFNIKSF